MSAKRVGMYRLQELVRLHRQACGQRRIARLLKMGRNTIRAYLEALKKAGLLEGDPGQLPSRKALKEAVAEFAPAQPAPQQVSTVEYWADEIREMLLLGAGPKAIYDRLRLDHEEFSGSLSAVKRLCMRLKGTEIKAEDVAIPVTSAPGEIAQVDFGYAGKIFDPEQGRPRRAWVFVMVLSHSRHQFSAIAYDQTAETWLRLHVEAFAELGGVPQIVVPDNLKAAVIRAAFGIDQPTGLNQSYRELARHYGFQIDPTPPRQPRKKGKVEASVKYVRRNFFKPRQLDATPIGIAQAELGRWVREIAGMRIHGTTGQRPLEVFEREERDCLGALPGAPFEIVVWKQAKVHADSHVSFERRLYSVPWRLIGKQVWLRATPTSLAVYAEEERVATHDRRGRGGRSTVDAHLPEHRVDLRHRSPDYWQQRAERLGEDVGSYIREVFESDEVLSSLRVVQAIVTHLERFPPERARAACRRASHFGSLAFGPIKNILRKGLDFEPLDVADGSADDDSAPRRSPGSLADPRFARTPSEFALSTHEVAHECH